MRSINHALTGALIGLTVTRPLVAMPLAVASHFVCDALPHYDPELAMTNVSQWISSKKFRVLLYIDGLLCVSFVLLLVVRLGGLDQPTRWWLPALCAFLATAPDLLWLKQFAQFNANKKWQAIGFSKLTVDIQWFHRPIGAAVEIAWFVAGCILLAPFLW
jgi:hypothetical protein